MTTSLVFSSTLKYGNVARVGQSFCHSNDRISNIDNSHAETLNACRTSLTTWTDSVKVVFAGGLPLSVIAMSNVYGFGLSSSKFKFSKNLSSVGGMSITPVTLLMRNMACRMVSKRTSPSISVSLIGAAHSSRNALTEIVATNNRICDSVPVLISGSNCGNHVLSKQQQQQQDHHRVIAACETDRQSITNAPIGSDLELCMDYASNSQ